MFFIYTEFSVLFVHPYNLLVFSSPSFIGLHRSDWMLEEQKKSQNKYPGQMFTMCQAGIYLLFDRPLGTNE